MLRRRTSPTLPVVHEESESGEQGVGEVAARLKKRVAEPGAKEESESRLANGFCGEEVCVEWTLAY